MVINSNCLEFGATKERVFSKQHGGLSGEGKVRRRKVLHFLIKDITFAKLMQEIKRNCLPLAHLPASNIRVRYRDEDGDMIRGGGYCHILAIWVCAAVKGMVFKQFTLG